MAAPLTLIYTEVRGIDGRPLTMIYVDLEVQADPSH